MDCVTGIMAEWPVISLILLKGRDDGASIVLVA
jgi:hypothetical protein